jgi:hypothetical protein
MGKDVIIGKVRDLKNGCCTYPQTVANVVSAALRPLPLLVWMDILCCSSTGRNESKDISTCGSSSFPPHTQCCHPAGLEACMMWCGCRRCLVKEAILRNGCVRTGGPGCAPQGLIVLHATCRPVPDLVLDLWQATWNAYSACEKLPAQAAAYNPLLKKRTVCAAYQTAKNC